MIEEPNVYAPAPSNLEFFPGKKPKALKIHVAENKRITKAKLSMAAGHAPQRSRAQPVPRDLLPKNPKALDKVRKQLKFEPNEEPEEPMLEETAEEEEESLKIEDQPTNQPLANGIEVETPSDRREKAESPNAGSLAINEKYAEQMLLKFNEIEKTFSPQNFLQNHKITPFMRSKMIDWLIEVLTSYKCLDETFFLAVSMMDRFFSKANIPQDVSELHLIGVTSIFIACKYEEIYPLRLQTVYERIGHKKLSCEQIKAKELEILEALDFNVTGPTVYDYLILLVHLIGIKKQMSAEKFATFEKIISYIAKLVIFEYDIIANKCISTIAAGVLYVSFKILEQIEPSFVLIDNIQKVKVLLNLEDSSLIEVASQILWLARNFDKMFQNLSNLKKFNTDLFDELQRLQNKNKEKEDTFSK